MSREQTLAWYKTILNQAAQKGPLHYRGVRRWLARNDLFFLLVMICKRKDLNHDWLFARCREVEAAPYGYLDLWAREHYKSTIITFGLNLQDILASHGKDPEPRYGGREVTIGIFSFNRPTAKAFLSQLKRELETNTDLQDLFDDILYRGSPNEIQRQAQKWSEDDGLIVKRRTNPKESTIEAHGLVDGQPTGKHFYIRNYDDVVTRESVTTPEMIQKVTGAWELSTNLGTEGGHYRIIGTRYHLFDTYATMMERSIPVRIYPCTSDGSEDFSKSVLKSREELEKMRLEQGPYTFGAQMLLNPTADRIQGFKEEWLQFWPAANREGLNIVMLVDPASKRKRNSDYTSIWVIGLDAVGNYMVLDMVRDRLNLTGRQTALFALHRKWRPTAVGYEEYGLQADIEHHKFVMGLQNYRFTITPLGGRMAKEDRIKRLIPLFENQQIFLPQRLIKTNYEGQTVDVVQQFIQEEYTAFPVVAHDDMLDCLSRILDTEMPKSRPQPPPEKTPEWMLEMYEEHWAQQNGADSWVTL